MMLESIKIQGLQVSYLDIGRGSTILFLHGWGTEASLYMPFLEHLSKRFRVLAPDLPGFGASDQPDSPWNTDDYVDFLLQFLEKLQIPECTPIGHSHGGRMIINWLSRAEQPVAVSKCVLCAAAGLKPHRGANYYFKVYTYKTAKLLLKPFPKMLERMKRRSGSADYRAASPVMRDTLTRVVNEDYTSRLPDIHAETLLVWGNEDDATPIGNARIMERDIPNAGLAVLEGSGHYALLEQSARFCRILDAFL